MSLGVCLSLSLALAIDVRVDKNPNKGLGILVDPKTNVVAQNWHQPLLKLGDKIIAVDGKPLHSYVGNALDAEKTTFTFSVDRKPQNVRRYLVDLIQRMSVEGPKPESVLVRQFDEPTIQRILDLAGALEDLCGGVDIAKADILGFWELIYSNDRNLTSVGISEYGFAPDCSIVGQYLCFQEANHPTMQVVEVVANLGMGTHQIASLKGDWEGSSDCVSMEFDNMFLQSSNVRPPKPIKWKMRPIHICENVMVVKAESNDGLLCVFERRREDDVRSCLGAFMERAPAQNTEVLSDAASISAPEGSLVSQWEAADLNRGSSGGSTDPWP